MNKIRVGIVGCGIIGSALNTWILKNNDNCTTLISDPPKGFNNDLSQADIIFISIHIPTENDNTQDLSLLKSIIKKLPDVPIYIRTTLLPGTCEKLSLALNKKVYFMPEFLTERTAIKDFEEQPMVFTGDIELLKKIFIDKKHIICTSTEAELSKYAHNVFGALKVTYFNGIYDLCKKMNCDYENVRQGLLLSGYINQMHTAVPGPDGKFGYGGKCFPKDVDAFISLTKDTNFGKLIQEIHNNNDFFRNK